MASPRPPQEADLRQGKHPVRVIGKRKKGKWKTKAAYLTLLAASGILSVLCGRWNVVDLSDCRGKKRSVENNNKKGVFFLVAGFSLRIFLFLRPSIWRVLRPCCEREDTLLS